jgi:hypothetical protein
MSDNIPFFLLGGYDLEMSEIQKMLERAGLKPGRDFADNQLSWGAKLSAYRQELSNSALSRRTIVGIELIEDIPPPQNYLRIDHHNDYSDRPAAIVQVAELLGITLSRRQQLIAANDSGYIPAMLAIGGSKAEIAEIRRLDRAAQGVTETDEAQAQTAIEGKKAVGKLTVVHSNSCKFSPITDRLFGTKRLLVYCATELNYFGEEKARLVNRFNELTQSGLAYHGGGESGYFGISADWTAAKWIEIRNEIIQMMKGDTSHA